MVNYTVLNKSDLVHENNAHEFQGYLFDNTEVSFILVDTPSGGGVRLHKHPYREIFIIQEGIALFTVGTEQLEAHAGQVIIAAAEVPHKFLNIGEGRLKQVDIHLNKQFVTDWLES